MAQGGGGRIWVRSVAVQSSLYVPLGDAVDVVITADNKRELTRSND